MSIMWLVVISLNTGGAIRATHPLSGGTIAKGNKQNHMHDMRVAYREMENRWGFCTLPFGGLEKL